MTAHPPIAAAAAPCYDFGGAHVGFRSRDAAWLEHVRVRFGPFAVAGEPSFTVAHDASAGVTGPEPEGVTIEAAPDGFAIRGPGFRATADLRGRHARVVGPEAASGVDCLVKRLVPHLVDRGLVLHAAAACEGDAGVLLAGPSGAGKTTIARLVGERALCDELAVVRVEGTAVRLDALPCWEARPGSARLAAIALLRHGARHEIRRLESRDALRRVGAEVVWPLYAPALVDRHLAAFGDVLARVPVFELEFAPRADVWERIAELMGPGDTP